MLKRLLSTIVSVVACIAVSAQGVCVISGNIADVKLSDGKKIKSVCLECTNELGQRTEVAVAKVKKGKYTFKHALAQDEPAMMYRITGFGEGKGIELFVEPGEVAVSTASAAEPCESVVTGTPANDVFSEYKAIMAKGCKKAEMPSSSRMQSKEAISRLSQAIKFLIEHNASPMTPLEIERTLLPKLSASYAEQMLNSISTSLHSHPYYLSLRNKVLANNLKVGSEAPDILLPLLGGEKKKLSDFRGKYVVLNFWANGSEKSDAMFAELQNLHNIVKDNKEQFVIVSFALEGDKAAWKSAVESKGVNVDAWLHACDGMGTDSPAAKLLAIEQAPHIVLIEPEGRVVSLNMEIDELVLRVEQILSGDLYYLDQED